MLLVRVPAFVVDGDVGDAALDEPAGDEAGLAESVAAVPIARLGRFLRQVEELPGVAEHELVRLFLGAVELPESAVGGHGLAQLVELVKERPARALALVGHAFGDDAFHGERLLAGVAACREGLVALAEESRFRESPLGRRQHDVRRHEALVAVVVALEDGDDRADGREDKPSGPAAGLRYVGRRLVSVHAVGHAADDAVLVGLFGK